jgi:hypothetical protein
LAYGPAITACLSLSLPALKVISGRPSPNCPRWTVVPSRSASFRLLQRTIDFRNGSFATDRRAPKIASCPQCPESDGGRQSVVRRNGPGADSAPAGVESACAPISGRTYRLV